MFEFTLVMNRPARAGRRVSLGIAGVRRLGTMSSRKRRVLEGLGVLGHSRKACGSAMGMLPTFRFIELAQNLASLACGQQRDFSGVVLVFDLRTSFGSGSRPALKVLLSWLAYCRFCDRLRRFPYDRYLNRYV